LIEAKAKLLNQKEQRKFNEDKNLGELLEKLKEFDFSVPKGAVYRAKGAVSREIEQLATATPQLPDFEALVEKLKNLSEFGAIEELYEGYKKAFLREDESSIITSKPDSAYLLLQLEVLKEKDKSNAPQYDKLIRLISELTSAIEEESTFLKAFDEKEKKPLPEDKKRQALASKKRLENKCDKLNKSACAIKSESVTINQAVLNFRASLRRVERQLNSQTPPEFPTG
jgi:hypothetical protein